MDSLLKEVGLFFDKKIDYMGQFPTGNYGITSKVMIGDDSYVMKMVPVNDRKRLEFILEFLTFINKQGVQVPNPIKNRDQNYLCESKYNDKEIVVYVYPMLDGKNLEDVFGEAVNHGLMFELGKEIYKLHKSMNAYHIKSFIKSWEESQGLYVLYEEVDPQIDHVILEMYEEYKNRLASHNLEMTSVIHGDIHMANILIDDSREFKFIDLEECILGHPLMDLAILMFDMPVICKDKITCQKAMSDLYKGYESVKSFSEKEKSALSLMLKMLETASYINFYRFKDEEDEWLNSFYMDRKDKIVNRIDYFELF